MAEQVYLGRYKVARQLDEGGMSLIYLARHTAQCRDVVVKVLKPLFQAQAKAREHFRREIHIMSRFQHPNAVQYLDAGPHEAAGPVLVMEYLRGVDLGVVMHHQPRFTPERTGRLLGQLCDVLQATHDAGIIHRDIKPGNLMILNAGTADETLKLMDFGLAKMTSVLYIAPDELNNYPEPAASGTPEYISPEEVRGTPIDARSDIYSVGVLLYELLAGRLPFENDNPQRLMRCHEVQTPPTFAEIGLENEISPAIEGVVRSCLSKQPQSQPHTATDLALRYEQALGKRITNFAGRRLRQLGRRAAPEQRERDRDPDASSVRAAWGHRDKKMEHIVEAVMPEALAMVKLKGFIHDLGGEVVESVPGMIRVRLIEQKEQKRSGIMSWLGGPPTSMVAVATAELELHMERRDPNQTNRLTITLVLNPANNLPATDLRERCNKMSRDLQAYLMGR